MDEVAGDQAVEHTLGEAGELLAAWSDPGRVQMTQVGDAFRSPPDHCVADLPPCDRMTLFDPLRTSYRG